MSDTDLIERLRPALALLPIECHDTADYAEATGKDFQAMTMRPDAFLALNALPELFDIIEQFTADVESLKRRAARTVRNRDMWKGQCERQADQLRAWREWHRKATADDDCEYLNGPGWVDAAALATVTLSGEVMGR